MLRRWALCCRSKPQLAAVPLLEAMQHEQLWTRCRALGQAPTLCARARARQQCVPQVQRLRPQQLQ